MEFLVFAGVFFGVLTSCLLLFFPASRKSLNKYLGITVIFLGYVLLISYFNGTGKILEFPYLIRTGHIPTYLIFPFLYLFYKGAITGEKKWKPEYWLFFLPSLVYLIDFSTFFVLDSQEKIQIFSGKVSNSEALFKADEGLFGIEKFHFVFRTLWGTSFLILIGKILWNYKSEFLKSSRREKSFFQFLVLIWGIFVILLLVPAVFNLVVKLQVYTVYFITVTLAMVLILISLSLFFYPSLLYGYIWDYKGELEKIKIVNDTIDSNKKRDDVTEGIQEDEIKIYQNLEKHILSNKSFQQIGFTIHMLAQETDIPAYKISTIINGIAKTNFNSWLNIYRVNFFIQLIESGEGEKYTLDSLSQQCGFSSRTTLINSFKKQTGNTPGNYLRSLKSQKS
ncbi:hypothetical protein Aoki45_34210 [Algoriphagus sp. oki45]|nr:hypothetical protein Aoki45_34210 [Algoriphagus sp. oki45]